MEFHLNEGVRKKRQGVPTTRLHCHVWCDEVAQDWMLGCHLRTTKEARVLEGAQGAISHSPSHVS